LIYFTSDLHFYHEKAINFVDRKSFTIESWIEMMCDKINSRVKKSDRLFILGDFALGKEKQIRKAKSLIKIKDCWLIHGNHDCSSKLLDEVWGNKWRYVHECKIKGAPTWLSHYPHLAWPKSHYGSFHLYGHLHDQREEFWNSMPELKERRSMDVCPESYKRIFGDFGIFSENEIYDLLSTKSGHDSVEWYRQQRGEL
jgi:calcineurin-like phosphoesterase family protein